MTESRAVVVRMGRAEGGEITRGTEKVTRLTDGFIFLIGGVCTYVKNYEIEHLKYVQLIVCQLCLNRAFETTFRYVYILTQSFHF